MSTTDLNLFRSIRSEQFPHGSIVDGVPAQGVLYPDFEQRELPSGGVRAPDVDVVTDKAGKQWVREGGGTSLFDVANVFKGKSWLSFTIPEGTVIPDSLVVRKTGFNKRFNATHYQIESATELIQMDAFKGALDNLARNALVRSLQLAKK